MIPACNLSGKLPCCGSNDFSPDGRAASLGENAVCALRCPRQNAETSEVTVRFGPDVRDWWVHPAQQHKGVDPAIIAWRGTNAAGQALQLFKTTWENPTPEVPVATLDYISAMSTAAPFLIAITAEP